MNILREYISQILSEGGSGDIMIPPPPSEDERAQELGLIQLQKQNPANPDDMQDHLDKRVGKLFNAIIKGAGYQSQKELIKQLKAEVKPIIKYHKAFFDAKRPNELANSLGYDFDFDYLETAQSPSYPSGHTTQAFYIAHKLSQMFPDLSEYFYTLAEMIAQSRVDRGVHFPSDNDAGKILAAKLAGMKINEANEYQWSKSTKLKMSLDKDGMDPADRKNQVDYLVAMGLMEEQK